MEQDKKLDLKKLLIMTALVLLTAGAVGGGVYYAMNQNFKKEREANEEALKEINNKFENLKLDKSSTKFKDETSDWEMYSNSLYGLSFKYPSTYNLVDKTSAVVGSKDDSPWYARNDFVKLDLELKSANKTLSAKLLLSTDKDKVKGAFGGTGKTVETFKVGTNDGYFVEEYGQGLGSQDIVVYVVGNQYSLSFLSNSSTDKEILKKILGTSELN